MTQDAIRSTIDQHSCVIRGIRYDFQLAWAAVEKYADPTLARHLLCVEVVASGQMSDETPERLQLFAWVEGLTELPAILTDALDSRLAEQMIKSRSKGARIPA